MTPTNELRFIERKANIPIGQAGNGSVPEAFGMTFHILQQKWIRPVEEQTTFATGSQVTEEWIDVPIVKETK